MTVDRPSSPSAGAIRVGIGGWTFAPWKETFYPPGTPARRELEVASRHVTAIEINGTFYSTMSAGSFARWHDETPDDFVFSVKAHRVTTHRRALADAGEAIEHFLGSGLAQLRDKLGPVLWQFMPTKRFDAADFEAFLRLLPRELAGRPLRHVLDVRHDSFQDPAFIELARRHGAAIVLTDAEQHPSIGNLTSDLVYLRLMRAESHRETGYDAPVLDAWAACARAWAAGDEPAGVPRVPGVEDAPAPPGGRDVFVFMINGAKERAPAAAMEVLRRLRG